MYRNDLWRSILVAKIRLEYQNLPPIYRLFTVLLGQFCCRGFIGSGDRPVYDINERQNAFQTADL